LRSSAEGAAIANTGRTTHRRSPALRLTSPATNLKNRDKFVNNNDILRRIRYTFNFTDSKMMAIFSRADHEVTRAQISDWLKKDDDPAFQPCRDPELAIFLNGLINDRRGKKEGKQPEPEQRLTNNIVFRKLKIALDLKADDILAIMALADLRMSKHELSAFFRKPEHKHYRDCKDQILRNFLHGLQRKYRATEPLPAGAKAKKS
jgi:uncharacterized protein YehS (DUF1456 family)